MKDFILLIGAISMFFLPFILLANHRGYLRACREFEHFFKLNLKKRYFAASTTCLQCHHKWVAVGQWMGFQNNLECPNCGQQKGNIITIECIGESHGL